MFGNNSEPSEVPCTTDKKTGRAINKARKDGIKIIEIGIKTLSWESNVKEIDIQYKLDTK